MGIAVVTGANRGLGRATADALSLQGLKVIYACRDPKKVAIAGADVRELDVTSADSIKRFAQGVLRDHGPIDILVNNAGIFIDDEDGGTTSALNTKRETVLYTFETNTVGPILLIQAFLPGMIERGSGRIVNVSSGMGQLSEMNGAYLSYRISKTALNTVTRVFADEVKGSDILINSVCPGWVKTDMGGAGAELPISEGIKGIVWAATLQRGGPSGGFFRHGERIEW